MCWNTDLEVHGPRVVLVHLPDHLDELLLTWVVAHGAQHHAQLLEGDALVTVHVEQVEYRPGHTAYS